ncbi:uncharacterized protein LOC101853080 [Aplysia californica]|uniref:Uncharacterized protein LOC101853080 n=1 Tax=Aplysia californica TaxID=6500 RepID=A0ABM1VRX4_APLCA|nr:uncharacterized protein LOC101853080 [Aplysia californica]XP_035825166.1 uncharacterized protein LOC101853080 [Aplysia californica]
MTPNKLILNWRPWKFSVASSSWFRLGVPSTGKRWQRPRLLSPSMSYKVNYLIDEGVLVGKGSNTVISLLHHFFETHGLGESAVSLHCDNCSGKNKNGFVLAYLRRRVLRGLHTEITLNFMIAGHTKFSPDLCFGLLKRKFQQAEVHCLEGMCRVVEESSSVNVPQLVETED